MHLLDKKRKAFVLWRPHHAAPPPRLVIGRFEPGNPPTLADLQSHELARSADHPDLWQIEPSDCGLVDNRTYHYWFEVTDSRPSGGSVRALCTDPTAFAVDWRLTENDCAAAVVTLANGELVPCEADGQPVPSPPPAAARAPSNNRMVVYELPTAWSRINVHGDPQIGVGTFRDVLALIAEDAEAMNFAVIGALRAGRSHLTELGINALELLPPADSFVEREWGYATSNYFAPDYDLGFPEGSSSPTPNVDLTELIAACHARDIRFIADVVMAFATRGAMETINFPDFHIDPRAEPNDPDAQQSGGQGTRDAFGGRLWRYARAVAGYDPVNGATRNIVPARQLMKLFLERWMRDFAIDGFRMDSVNNVANWDFVQEFKDLARGTWRQLGGADDKFLVVGEELSVPLGLLAQDRLDALWNEDFKRMVRNAVLGRNDDEEPSFEWSVRKMIDCRLLGFTDGAQAVNYVGSHDVEGFRNERLHDFLENNGIAFKEKRIKLAFACLLTAVGIPMILAGDEFADEHDLAVSHPPKQRDAVNFGRVDEPFRRRVFEYVARLVKFRTASDALAVNDTEFIHADFDDGKRVVAWRRGRPGAEQVVVVANFSDFETAHAGSPSAEYRVPNWPPTPLGKKWREISQSRDVPQAWVAREPIYPWEAKVYALIDP